MNPGSRTRRFLALGNEFGLNPRKSVASLRLLPAYVRSAREHKEAFGDEFAFERRPCLSDAAVTNGSTSGHYFHQDLHVARRIFDAGPARHVDVGSRIDGFVAHVASFREVEVLDVRAPSTSIPNVSFVVADLSAALPDFLLDSTPSLSCLHALEHFGLGRYGDPIDPNAYLRGFSNLTSMVVLGGTLYLSVPITNRPRIEFNAHRVMSLPQVLRMFRDSFAIQSVHVVDDGGDFMGEVDWTGSGAQRTFGLNYGCAIVEAVKH